MQQNRDLFLILMGHNGAPQFAERTKRLMWPVVQASWQSEFPEYAPNDLELVYDFVFSGAMQLFLQWVEDDKGMSAEQIARRLDRLGHYCHLAIREF